MIELISHRLSAADRNWYAERAAADGWRRDVLRHQITTGLRQRLGAAANNFERTLDPDDSDQARELIRDPYIFDRLGLTGSLQEKDLGHRLLDQLQTTLLEFGRGLALVGRRVRITLTDQNGDTTQIIPDLLFFHIPQARNLVVELKTRPFQAAHAGQLAAYVAAIDGELREPHRHAPTIGLLLCTGHHHTLVHYALAGTGAPLAVADWTTLPAELQAALPNPDRLTAILKPNLT